MEVIKIGGIDYAVTYKEIEEGHFGAIEFKNTEIVINNHHIVKQKQEQTLVHEVMHAILHEAGLDELNGDEDAVNDMSLILHQVLKDNDFSWLHKQMN